MLVSELIRGLPIERSGDDVDIQGVSFDSRRVERGDLFAAFVGERFDARKFVPDAISKGAIAVLAPTPSPAEHTGPWLVAAEPRAVVGALASRVYGHPDREMLMAGVTGTNGKSTIIELISSILQSAGKPCGRIGTLGYRFIDSLPAPRTTPEAPDLFRMLREMRDRGAAAVAMEVSSHAIAQGRVDGLSLDVALFTNLTRDHLDFHGDLEEYFRTKTRIFDSLKDGARGVVHIGDPYGARLAAENEELLTYGVGGDVYAYDATVGLDGIRAKIVTPRGDVEIESPLVGAYNLENIVAAVAAGFALDLSDDEIAAGVASCPVVRGRMERVEGDVPVFVDFAHTDAALRAALTSARELSEREVILVFGCGGDRDPGKRELMGQVAGELADFVILTSDNPRSEDPLAIIAAVEKGIQRSGNDRYRIVPDRREAIRRAVERGGEDRLVLVAGKGHEEVQIIGDERIPFSDREEIIRALEGRNGAGSDE